MKNKSEPIIEVVCDGCGRTQRVRVSKIVPCQGYTCSLSSCKQNQDFKLPEVPHGFVRSITMNAAGGFSGWAIRLATDEELESIERAKAIRDAGIARFHLRDNLG